MISLIRRTFGRWFRGEKKCIKPISKASNSFYVPYEVRDYNAIKQRFSTGGYRRNLTTGLKGNLHNAVQNCKECRGLEIDDWGLSACHARENALNIHGHIGFVDHDGIPWLYDEDEGCWLPVTKSRRYASAYAALHRAASPPQPQAS